MENFVQREGDGKPGRQCQKVIPDRRQIKICVQAIADGQQHRIVEDIDAEAGPAHIPGKGVFAVKIPPAAAAASRGRLNRASAS